MGGTKSEPDGLLCFRVVRAWPTQRKDFSQGHGLGHWRLGTTQGLHSVTVPFFGFLCPLCITLSYVGGGAGREQGMILKPLNQMPP